MAKVYVVTADVDVHWMDRQVVGVAPSLYEAKLLAWKFLGLSDASEADASGLPFFAVYECEWGEITTAAVQTFNPDSAPYDTKVTFEHFRQMWRWWDELHHGPDA